jgi:FkbM family methyltransferase
MRFLIRRIPCIGPGTWGCRYYVPPAPKHLPDIIEEPLIGYPLRIRYNPHQFIGWYIYYRGIFEPALLKLVYERLRPDMTFLDIGANIGLYSIVSSLKVGESGKVYAFEPQPNLANIIQQNATLNNLNNITINNCALSDKSGTMELYFPDPKNDGEATLGRLTSNSVSNISVDVKTLDDLYEKSQLFLKTDYAIKIDIEGAELLALNGGRGIFQQKLPEFIFYWNVSINF